ncbi:type IV pilus modification protein PilV [Pseudothauera nasutitermitis]|uniref:Type IV pilus modification protein PilV n=1 Tax=Pseudothauera nasutitermitis TaxID=2565930 RepID=A0A4S4AYC9_9RHOO|nr:type IV pilus modification protein PilV [Pseudothauera nasutitermitis]THF64666.1 type IV pilus modification protein PilV [Pseudothauera nasutitermitis]
MNKQTGSSLLEVLVAMLVLAFGLLGLAGLQATSVRSNHSAYLRTQATLLAYDLADRMRAMQAAVENGDYDDSSTGDERSAWNQSVTRALGAGATGTVVRNGGFVTITIAWDDNRGRIRQSGAADENAQSFVYETEL